MLKIQPAGQRRFPGEDEDECGEQQNEQERWDYLLLHTYVLAARYFGVSPA
jgi:hypothetical protein